MKSKTKKLKHGYTTGAYAVATALAAANFLFTNKILSLVRIELPKKKWVDLAVFNVQKEKLGACASAIKDAGDDPDVTHGCVLYTHVRLIQKKGIVFKAGKGVGVVTKSGLPIGIGEPAINPSPRLMIERHLENLAQLTCYQGGFVITINIENGEELAKKTLGPRLGIVGGLCILGTTGIVKPFSCGAYIASIYQAIDVAISNACDHLVLVTGSTSLKYALDSNQFQPISVIEVGDFLSAAFKRLRRYRLKKLTLVSGWAKMLKVAQCNDNLHHHFSSVDRSDLLIYMRNDENKKRLFSANTMLELIDCFDDQAKKDLLKRCVNFLQHNVQTESIQAMAVGRTAKMIFKI